MTNAVETQTTACCIIGGGPAGIMAGYLLARAGIDVIVMEKHADFFRDFRGDTIHPSTLEILYDLGLLEAFLKLPHNEVKTLNVQMNGQLYPIADFSHIQAHCQFLGFLPQWDFLNFIADQAKCYANFQLRLQTDVQSVIEENNQIVGVNAVNPQGSLVVRAQLIISADGRSSTVRQSAGLHVMDLGAPMDILWFSLSRLETDPESVLGTVGKGHFLIMINRQEYWQCGFVVAKGTLAEFQKNGLADFKASLTELVPFMADRIDEITDFEQLKLLSVSVNRLKQWYRPGLLCIGDSAHAMSPIGGVGINLAIQDAVAAVNILAIPLKNGRVTTSILRRVQQRRELPTRLIQHGQVFVQNNGIKKILRDQEFKTPLVIKILSHVPLIRMWFATIIGLGIRSERINRKLFNVLPRG